MSVLLAMVRKDLSLLLRDKLTLFFTFGFPLIFAAFFGSIFSTGGTVSGISVAVTDLDRSPESRAFIQRMSDMAELRVTEAPEAEARNLTRRGKKSAFIILPDGFGIAFRTVFAGSPPEVVIGVDPSRKAEAGMLEGVMMKLGVERFERVFSDSGALGTQLDQSIANVQASNNIPEKWRSLLGEFLPQIKSLVDEDAANNGGETGKTPSGMDEVLTPLKIVPEDVVVQREGPTNAYAITMPQGMFWAMMGVVMGFGTALVQEKSSGTMERLAVAPITRMEILGGKALGCFLALVLVLGVFFLVARFVFEVPVDRPDKVLFTVVSAASAFVGIMMFLAALGKTERGMSSLGWGIMMLFGMFGGAMVPLMVMPGWMVTVSQFSPVKWAVLMFEGATWRQFPYSELLVPCAGLLTLGIVLFALGARLIKLQR